ncbi:hypothetical protein LguiA_004665 [Lonicera macranthoides]
MPQSAVGLVSITTLNLSGMGLAGTFPSVIGNLSFLNSLDISYNNFNGSLPKELSHLHDLQHLFLFNNSFTGNLTKLESLNVRFNQLIGSVPDVIFNISSLRVIDLSSNDLYGSLPVDFCSRYFLKLERIYLPFNRFKGPENSIELFKWKELQYLSLAFNEFSGSIPMEIGNWTRLKHLYFGYNNLEEMDTSSVKQMPTYTVTGTMIQRQYLSQETFLGPLPSSMGLWIPNLQRLYLGKNRLSRSFPNFIFNAFNLRMIDMSSNSFTSSIPNTLGNLSDLEWLMIGENNLTREVSTPELRFFNYLTNCKNLKMFSISINQFNGILPASIVNLSTSLRMFEAFGCKIKGEIPIGIGNLSSLTNLVLDSNKFTGFIPSTIERLENLKCLYPEHNDLRGSIPNDLCRLKRMGYLYLSHNKLDGLIPLCLGELRTMRRLFLDSNNLTSTIPLTLWSLEDPLYLNLCYPNTIASGQMLTFLSLAHNKLQGSIPQSLGKLVSLELLDLSINNFSRPIPMSLERLRITNPNEFIASCFEKVFVKLLLAKNGFSESNLLGVGGVGSVYKGIMSDEVNVAVKVFNLQLKEAFKSFNVECGVLRNIRHRNLTKIVRSCSNLDFITLVLKYMPNGSLEKWLYFHNYCLTILERLNIMIDVVSALEYLHQGQTTPILHCDLKPSNVLLDKDMIAHVCDFGIAKLLGEDECMAQTKTLATIGYMAPGNLPALFFQLLL